METEGLKISARTWSFDTVYYSTETNKASKALAFNVLEKLAKQEI